MDGGWNEIVDPGNRYNSPNFSAGRPEPYHQITHIIVHICGSFEGARDRFLTVDEAATHYVIKDDGTITQFIQDINRGWHAGILEGQYTFRGVRYNSIVVTNQTSVIQPYKVHEKNLYERATDEWKRWRLGWPRRLNGLWEYYYVANPSDIYNWDMVYPGYDKPFNYLINPYPNNYSIGIELVGGTFYTEEDYTYRSAQIDGLVKLLKDLIRKYSIPVTREFLVGHEDVNPIARFRWDPGPGFNWDDILVRVKPQIAYPLQKEKSSTIPHLWRYQQLESGKRGFFPIGANVCTHSGIHIFSKQSTAVPVRAMAPGYVVAYRFLTPDVEREMRSNQDDALMYEEDGQQYHRFIDPSFSSFVLLKHDIKVRIDENDESLSFYSLYMSLAPIKMAKIEEVPWYHTLACLINGANIETENYKRLGHFEWLSLDSEDEADHPGREENHNIYNINFVSRGDFFFLIKENEPKKIITFSEPLLKVEGGEIIGFIEKMADSDPQNFVHWEVLAPASEDVFKKIAKVYGNENLFETVIENDNYHTAAELRTVFDGHEFFQFQGVTLVEYDANLFTSLLQDIRDAIFPNSNDLQEYLLSDKMPFNNWISLYYTKDNSYSMELKLEEVAASAYSYVNNTLVINITAYTSLENEIGVFLKGKKSGLNIEFKYPTSDMGNDYSENISVTLQELQSGLNLTIPTLAKELTIEDIDSTFVDMRINYEGQNDLFDTESQDNLRNVLLKHKLLWTEQAMQSLIDALKNNQVLTNYTFQADDFEASIWFAGNKEIAIYQTLFSTSMLSPDAVYHNIHPVTAIWLLDLTADMGVVRFNTERNPREFAEENNIVKYGFFLPASQDHIEDDNGGHVTCLGGEAKLLLLGKAIRPGPVPDEKINLPRGESNKGYSKGLNKLGLRCQEIQLHFWGDYDPQLSGTVVLGNIPRIMINKPVIRGISYQDNPPVSLKNNELPPFRVFFDINGGNTRPLLLAGIICLQYAKHPKKGDPGEFTDFSRGILIAAERNSSESQLEAQFESFVIFKEIVLEAGCMQNDEVISLKAQFLAPNGGIITLGVSRNDALSGTKLIDINQEWKNKADSLFYPRDFQPISDTLVLPAFSGMSDETAYPNFENQYIVECAAIFSNAAWKWMVPEDFSITGTTTAGANLVINHSRYTRIEDNTLLSIGINLPDNFFSEDKDSETVSLNIKYELANPEDESAAPTIIYTQDCDCVIPKPGIIEVSHSLVEMNLELGITTMGIPSWAEFYLHITWADDNDNTWVNVVATVSLDGDGQTISCKVEPGYITGNKITAIALVAKNIKGAVFPAELKQETNLLLAGLSGQIDAGLLQRTTEHNRTFVRANPVYPDPTANNRQVKIYENHPVRFIPDNEGKRQIVTGSSDFYRIETVVENVTYHGWVLTMYLEHIPEPETPETPEETTSPPAEEITQEDT